MSNCNPMPSYKAQTWPKVVEHLRIGWWMLLAFLSFGIALEALHGLKIGFYLNQDREITRTMWTISHAVGSILGLLHIAAAASIFIVSDWSNRNVAVVSMCLKSASILIPAGFFLAGCFATGAEMGKGILLVIPGVGMCLLALIVLARGLGRAWN